MDSHESRHFFTFELFVSRGRAGSVRGTGREVFEGVEKSVHPPVRSAARLLSSSSSFSLSPVLPPLVTTPRAPCPQPFSWFMIGRFSVIIYSRDVVPSHSRRLATRPTRERATFPPRLWKAGRSVDLIARGEAAATRRISRERISLTSINLGRWGP